ncbi:MAG: PilN domain-containing protein [Pseudomonadota bacterium]|nr:PilN domain-containing protein [Pseudomonadota bacterium]
MILINLLPHREEKRRRKKIAFFAGVAASAVAGLLAVGIWYGVVEQLKSSQQERNAYLGTEIKKLEDQIKDVAALNAEIESLKSRQKAVEDLQTDRNVPVYLLNELVKQTPEGLYFTSVKQTGQLLSVLGIAQTNERVSEFLRNTAYNSEWLEKPQLVEIKVSGAQAADRTQKRLFDFSIRVNVKRPQEKPVPVAMPASGSAPNAAAVASAATKG